MSKGQNNARPREQLLAEDGNENNRTDKIDSVQLMEMVIRQKADVVELQRRIRKRIKNESKIRNQAKLIAEAQKNLAAMLQGGERVMTLEMLETDILDTFGVAVHVITPINSEVKTIKDLLSNIPTVAERGVAAPTRSRQGQLQSEQGAIQRTSTMMTRGGNRGRGRGRLEYSPPIQRSVDDG